MTIYSLDILFSSLRGLDGEKWLPREGGHSSGKAQVTWKWGLPPALTYAAGPHRAWRPSSGQAFRCPQRPWPSPCIPQTPSSQITCPKCLIKKESGKKERERERKELFPKLLNSVTKQTVMRVASSQLSVHPQPLVSAVWSSHLHPRVSGHSGLLFTPCVSRGSHGLRTLNSPLMWRKDIGSFRNVLTHIDFKCIILPNGWKRSSF